MRIRIGLENKIENRTLAWALDYPGCFAYGDDDSEALIRLPQALLKYEIWIKDHTPDAWVHFDDLDMHVAESFETFNIDEKYQLVPSGEGYEVNAWFLDDWRPLSGAEISQAHKIFIWQRDELLAGLTTLEPELLTAAHPGEKWHILDIARHIATAEWWYLSRLDLAGFKRSALAENTEKALAQMAELVQNTLPELSDKVYVVGKDGEFWSYRKLVRRLLYHQRDHIEHIKSLVL